MNCRHELPITLEIEFTENMGVCIPLCILATETNYRNWFNTNFMMPIACVNKDTLFEYIIIDGVRYGWMSQIPAELLRFTYIGDVFLRNTSDIIKLIVDQIDYDWYCGLFLDQYYLPCESKYHKYHFVHELLIYGYDFERRIFQAVTYGNKLHKAEIDFDDFTQAYVSAFNYIADRGGWREYMLMQYSLIGHTKEYPFNRNEFVRKLKLYYEGELSQEIFWKQCLYMNYDADACFYGIHANNAMLLKLRAIQEKFYSSNEQSRYNIFQQYVPIHTFAEYHKALYKRLLYYDATSSTNVTGNATIKKYEKIVETCEIIRFLYIKTQILSERRDDIRITKTLTSIIDKFEFIANYESEIISLILETFLSRL